MPQIFVPLRSHSTTGTAYLHGFRDVHEQEHVLGPKEEVSKAVLGTRPVCIITKSGDLLFWNDVGCQPDRISTEGPVEDVALGNEDAIILQRDGTMGRLLHSTLNVQPISLFHKVAAVACGMAHNLALTYEGVVFTWGCSNHGELGHGTLDSEEAPKVVEALEGIYIRNIAAGGWHSAAVSDCDDLYLWGWNESGQLGILRPSGSRPHKDSVTVAPLPLLFTALGDVSFQSVECGSRHTAALTKCGSAYAWGSNSYGQLSIDKDIESSHDPHKIKLPEKHKAVGLCCKFWGTVVECKESDEGL